MKSWHALMESLGTRQEMPLKPQVVGLELGKLLADDAIFVSDSGTISTWYARYLPFRYGQKCTLSGNLATMACGLPYAIGAQIAYPERQVIAIVGDGGFSMLMAEFVTAVKYKLPIKVVIFKNNSLGQIKWEQVAFLGNPEYECDLAPIDFVKFAEACGGTGYRIDEPQNCKAILEQALAHPGPVVIEAVVDQNEPPLPPTASIQDALNLLKAVAKGTEGGLNITKHIIADKVREIV